VDVPFENIERNCFTVKRDKVAKLRRKGKGEDEADAIGDSRGADCPINPS
jgi:hypothetical protein